MRLHHCWCFHEHVGMLLHSLRAFCKAPGGGWDHLEVLRSTGKGYQSVGEVCIWRPDRITSCCCKGVTKPAPYQVYSMDYSPKNSFSISFVFCKVIFPGDTKRYKPSHFKYRGIFNYPISFVEQRSASLQRMVPTNDRIAQHHTISLLAATACLPHSLKISDKCEPRSNDEDYST
jgi:hypothetical protein